jgi:hypothetical protein
MVDSHQGPTMLASMELAESDQSFDELNHVNSGDCKYSPHALARNTHVGGSRVEKPSKAEESLLH